MKTVNVLLTAALAVAVTSANASGLKNPSKENRAIYVQEIVLPQAIKEVMDEKFPGYEIKEVEKEKEKGETVYEVEFMWKGERWEVYFSETGEILKQEREDEEDEDDD